MSAHPNPADDPVSAYFAADWNAKRLDELCEAIEDMDRGLLSPAELVAKARELD